MKRMPSARGSAEAASRQKKPRRAVSIVFRSERTFQNSIMRLAIESGWLGYCHPDSRKSASISTPGFPDIFLLKPGRVVIMETKMPKNKAHDDQLIWLTILYSLLSILSSIRLTIGVFYPDDWPEIERIIKEE